MSPVFTTFLALTALASSAVAAQPKPKAPNGLKPGPAVYLIANEDSGPPLNNGITFFQASGTQLTLLDSVLTEGVGIGGGYFGVSRVISPPDGSACIYASEAASGDIAALGMPSQELLGQFYGSDDDSGASNGIGLAMNAKFLYAGFPDSNTIATFAVEDGCQLSFEGDTSVGGLNGGQVSGMAAHGNLLVVTYGDGSIESFDVSGGSPISNGDLQNSTGFVNDNNNMPSSVDITQDGHFAIFGDIAVGTIVEVADISSGKLAATVPFIAANGPNAGQNNVSSSTVRLSPDESLLYIGNSQGGTVTGAFFDKATGKIRSGCVTPAMNSYYNAWWFVGSIATRDTTGTGGVVYAAEFPGNIAIVSVQSDGRTCTLTEAAGSPAQDPFVKGLLSIWVYPPRPF